MLKIHKDGLDQPFVQWVVCNDYRVRAWIQIKTGADDWANSGRYLNVVRCHDVTGNPNGNPTVFPIFNRRADSEILQEFAASACSITGGPLEDDPNA